MACTRSRTTPGLSIFPVIMFLLCLFSCGVAASSAINNSASPANSASASADDELICHTDDPADCYPKLFKPTDEFQFVHEDQDLPKGLHVRINVQTGQREAKINVPDEIDPSLEGLPVDSSILVVEQEQAQDLKPPKDAPQYEMAGKIKVPREESGEFYEALAWVKKGSSLDQALESLEEVSHDIYYGLKIAEDYDTVRALFCLANSGQIYSPDAHEDVPRHAKLAALTLSSALQNNPKALAEVEKHWSKLQQETCPQTAETLGPAIFRLTSTDGSQKLPAGAPQLARLRIATISGLLRSPAIRKDFFAHGGTEHLLAVLAQDDAATWDGAQIKVGNLLLDNFLDQDLGATLGEWPRGGQDADGTCQERHGDSATEACWDWTVQRLAGVNKGDKEHWSHELWAKLQEQRTANRKLGKDEL